jgi:hypothetical protein
MNIQDFFKDQKNVVNLIVVVVVLAAGAYFLFLKPGTSVGSYEECIASVDTIKNLRTQIYEKQREQGLPTDEHNPERIERETNELRENCAREFNR